MLDGLVPFSRLAGATVHWGRLGARGTRHLMPAFLARLEAALEDLWETSGLGVAEAIVSGGAYVDRPPTPGDRHAIGTAFDLVAVHWIQAGHRSPGQPEPLRAYRADQDPRRYLGTEAILRLHLPQVLGRWYDEDHHGHWHVDDKESAAGFSPGSRADVRYLQAALTHVWGLDPGPVDGVLGRRTLEAAAEACQQIGQPEVISQPEVWRAWLGATARGGWGRAEAG